MRHFSFDRWLGKSRIDVPLARTRQEESRHPITLVTPCKDLNRVRTVICGHSNAAPLYRVLVPKGNEETPSIRTGLQLGLAGLHAPAIDQNYLALVRQLGRTRNIAFVWEGNQANADFLLSPGVPFDFVPRGYSDTSTLPDVQIVPESGIREHLSPSLGPLDALLGELGQPDGLLRIVVGIQPPLADNGLIRERLNHEPHYARRAAQFGVDLATIPIAAPSVRRKLWFTMTGLYREMASRHGALFVDTAPGAFDANGFLRVDHSGGDVTHAGLAYGRLMIERLAEALTASPP